MYNKNHTILILSFIVFMSNIYSQSIYKNSNYFTLPQQTEHRNIKQIAGFSSASLPEDYIEEASDFLKAPLFGYAINYGLPKNFLLKGSVNTNIITWQIAAGGKWNYVFNKLSLAVGYDLAFVYGQLNQFGFKSKITSWINYPNLTLGYKFKKFAISFSTEAVVVTSLTEYADDEEIGNSKNKFAGVIFTTFIEQPLWKDNYLTIGFRMNYTKFYYPACKKSQNNYN